MEIYEYAAAYETKSQTVFGKFPTKKNYHSAIIANGEPLIKTFKKDWYKVEGKLTSLEEVWVEKINKRYELIDKELYNEKIPLLIDESTKEKYLSLIENNLYKKVYDEAEAREAIPFKTVEVDLSIPFDIKTAKKFRIRNGWYCSDEYHEQYIIDLVEYSPVESCIIPSPLLDLTRPCRLTGRFLFQVLTDMIAVQKPNNYRISENTDNIFRVMSADRSKTIISWTHWDSNSTKNSFETKVVWANNYEELIGKLHALTAYICQELSEHDGAEVNRAIIESSQGKDFRSTTEPKEFVI